MDILTVNGVLGGENIDSSSPMHPPGLAEAHGELGEQLQTPSRKRRQSRPMPPTCRRHRSGCSGRSGSSTRRRQNKMGCPGTSKDCTWQMTKFGQFGQVWVQQVQILYLTRFGRLPPPRGGWMRKVIPLIVSIKMMAHQRTWSIAQRLGDHVAIREHVIDHHLQMLHRGFDRRYYTR